MRHRRAAAVPVKLSPRHRLVALGLAKTACARELQEHLCFVGLVAPSQVAPPLPAIERGLDAHAYRPLRPIAGC